MLILALAATASADPMPSGDIACEPAYVTDSLPEVGQAAVPTDADLVLLLDGQCGASIHHVTVTEESTGNVLFDSELTTDVGAEVIDLPELLPATGYAAHITPIDGWGSELLIPFSTGEAGAVGMDDSVPAITINGADIYNEGGGYITANFDTTITPVVDPDAMSYLAVRVIDGPTRYIALHDGSDAPQDVFFSWSLEDEPAEFCVEVTQIDARGWEAASEISCEATTVHTGGVLPGCSTTGGAAGLLALLPGLLAAVRRRR